MVVQVCACQTDLNEFCNVCKPPMNPNETRAGYGNSTEEAGRQALKISPLTAQELAGERSKLEARIKVLEVALKDAINAVKYDRLTLEVKANAWKKVLEGG
jgi:hypothetical protein